MVVINKEPAIVVAARACVVKDRKLLLVSNNGNFWYLPGGHMEVEETLPICAKREVYEETGYDVSIDEMIYCYEFFDHKFKSHKIECVFRATVNNSPEGKWHDLGHDKSVTMSQFFSMEELQPLELMHPLYLKEGKWLEPAAEKIYMGFEESKK